MSRILLGIALLLAAWLAGSHFMSADTSTDASDRFPHRRQLQRAAWNSGTWLIVYHAENPAERVAYEALLRPLDGRQARRTQLRVFALEEVPDSLLASYPIYFIGTDWPAVLTKQLNNLPDLRVDITKIVLGNYTLRQADDILKLTYLPSPFNDTLPVHLMAGRSAAALQSHLKNRLSQGANTLLWSAWGYELVRNERTIMQGYFNDSTWQMDRKVHFEFDHQARDTWSNAAATLKAFDGATAPPEQWLQRLLSDRDSVQSFTGYADLPPLNIHLHPSVERKALRTRSMRQAHFDADADVTHLVINDRFFGQEWGVHYRSWLRTALGRSASKVYEIGLAMRWTDRLRGRSWRAWVRTLNAAEALPPLELLFNEEERSRYAPLIGDLAAAAWVDFRVQTLGRDAFLKEYRSGYRGSERDEGAWHAWIDAHYPSPTIKRPSVPEHRLNGFTLAHEGYNVYNGYGSERAYASLRAMRQTGIKAVALVPYSFMADARRPDPIPVSQNAGSENDEATVFAHLAAQSLEQFTLLKPQIWMGGGSWPGDINFQTDAEWRTFFTHYGRWIKHYALLAELYGFDAFCAGTEMRHTTLQRPEEWRALLASIRRIYSGSLTYAANWGEECEKMTFWSDLDFVGVNCYYPLTPSEDPTDEELLEGAESVLQKIQSIGQAAQRPVWLTEIGYRSATTPWRQPHAEAGRRAVDEAAQARAYAAMLKAARDQTWLRGFFWWKWPSDLEHDESRGRGYSPYGKPAEKVLGTAYLGS